MNDKDIIQLYLNRDQRALSATAKKYGKYCTSIAKNILGNNEDAEECVNDTYLSTWNSIPPTIPTILSAFLGKITRNLAFNKYKHNHVMKRGNGEIAVVLDELAECVSGVDDVEQEIDRRELVATINSFLETLPPKKRNIFICRYWYSDSVSSIARRYEMTESNVSVTLNRLRSKLKEYLSERGLCIMKKEDLFDTLGDINNQYIKEAHMNNKRKNNFVWVKWGTIAACFALLVLCTPMVTRLSPVEDTNTPTVESLPIENNNKVEDLQNNKEESVNIQESKSTEIEDTSETIIEDVPADNKGEYNEEVNSSDLTKDTSEFFGGSYTDANGKFVIVLTEDTPANRTAICKELGRSESNTTFVKGTYTLAYLTELQEKITNAMVNKEIPFVVTSGVYETTNNIIIRVTTNDEAELAKVYALDTIGGAIKVEFSAGAVVEELLLPLPKAE